MSLEDSDSAENDPAETVQRIEITGTLDRHAVEAMRLEIRRLSRHYGIDITEFRIERVKRESSA